MEMIWHYNERIQFDIRTNLSYLTPAVCNN